MAATGGFASTPLTRGIGHDADRQERQSCGFPLISIEPIRSPDQMRPLSGVAVSCVPGTKRAVSGGTDSRPLGRCEKKRRVGETSATPYSTGTCALFYRADRIFADHRDFARTETCAEGHRHMIYSMLSQSIEDRVCIVGDTEVTFSDGRSRPPTLVIPPEIRLVLAGPGRIAKTRPRTVKPRRSRHPIPLHFTLAPSTPTKWPRSFSPSVQTLSKISDSGSSRCANLMVNGRAYMTGSLNVISTSMWP